MKAAEGALGRVFILRLEDGDVLPESIERFAAEKGISTGCALFIGDVKDGNIVAGPRRPGLEKPEPLVLPVDGVHEVVAAGTIAPDSSGRPVLHIHGALGRAGHTATGCLRPGVTTWLVGEVVIFEILGITAARLHDDLSGFDLLEIRQGIHNSDLKESSR